MAFNHPINNLDLFKKRFPKKKKKKYIPLKKAKKREDKISLHFVLDCHLVSKRMQKNLKHA